MQISSLRKGRPKFADEGKSYQEQNSNLKMDVLLFHEIDKSMQQLGIIFRAILLYPSSPFYLQCCMYMSSCWLKNPHEPGKYVV